MRKRFFQNNIFVIVLIAVGVLTWSLTMFKSGLVYSFGMGFWGPNGHDGIWHIALAESLARGSFEMPTFAGETLKNYHIGFDLLLAGINKIFGIPIINLYFHILPPLISLLVGLLTYKFVYLWRESKKEALWATFFVYFGGSIGWIFTMIRSGEIGGESMFWSQQAISTLINPPFALSLVLLLSGMIFLIKYLRNKSALYLLLSVIFFGVLIQVKVYASVLVLGSLLVSGVFYLAREKNWSLLKVFAGTLALSVLLYLPFNKDASNLLVYQPFWFLETMMGLSDRFGWERFYSAMTTYKLSGNWFKAVPAYLVAFAIFWIGNMGTRILKEFLVIKWLRNLKNISWVEVFVSSLVVAGGLIPMFFLQKGTPWNTIQFLYYSLFGSSILVGVAIAEFRLGKWAVAGLVLLTVPTNFGTLRHYLPSRPPSMLPTAEIQALKFLKDQPRGIVLTYPFDRIKAKEAEAYPPRPLYLYESTAYVSAFSSKSVYLEDEINLDITDYNWPERRKKVEDFINTLDQTQARSFLSENNINYIYWIKGQRARLGETQLGISRIFENKEVDIYKRVITQ